MNRDKFITSINSAKAVKASIYTDCFSFTDIIIIKAVKDMYSEQIKLYGNCGILSVKMENCIEETVDYGTLYHFGELNLFVA